MVESVEVAAAYTSPAEFTPRPELVRPKVRLPSVAPPTAFNCPAMVVEALAAKEVVVALPLSERLRPVMRPVLEMEKRVESTPADVVEDIWKSVVVAVVEAAKMLKSAVGAGVDEPMERPLRKLAASK